MFPVHPVIYIHFTGCCLPFCASFSDCLFEIELEKTALEYYFFHCCAIVCSLVYWKCKFFSTFRINPVNWKFAFWTSSTINTTSWLGNVIFCKTISRQLLRFVQWYFTELNKHHQLDLWRDTFINVNLKFKMNSTKVYFQLQLFVILNECQLTDDWQFVVIAF